MIQAGAIALGLLFAVAGVTHFTSPGFYTRLLPLWLGGHRQWVAFTGALEIACGALLLLPGTRALGGALAVVLLLAFLLVHVNMLVDREAGLGLPRWALGLRLAFQFVLLAWAWTYAAPLFA